MEKKPCSGDLCIYISIILIYNHSRSPPGRTPRGVFDYVSYSGPFHPRLVFLLKLVMLFYTGHYLLNLILLFCNPFLLMSGSGKPNLKSGACHAPQASLFLEEKEWGRERWESHISWKQSERKLNKKAPRARENVAHSISSMDVNRVMSCGVG